MWVAMCSLMHCSLMHLCSHAPFALTTRTLHDFCPQINEWAQVILAWSRTYGVQDSVMLLEDLSSGDDVRGTGDYDG